MSRLSLNQSRRTDALAFSIILLVTGLIGWLQGVHVQYFDTAGYVALGSTFIADGHFSLLNYSDAVRGYLFPLFLLGWEQVIAALRLTGWGPQVINSFIVATSCGLLAPRLAEAIWPQVKRRPGIWPRLAVAAAFLFFWWGYLPYYLSDLPAWGLGLFAVTMLVRADSPVRALVGGLALGAAILVRPAYLLLAPTALLLLVMVPLVRAGVAARRTGTHQDRRTVGLRVLGAVLAVAAMGTIMAPQSAIAQKHYGLSSPIPGAAANLGGIQLTVGLTWQRYETWIGTNPPPGPMIYTEPEGVKLLALQGDGAVQDGREYASIIKQHPLTMLGIWARHGVNGFDQRYASTYVSELEISALGNLRRVLGFMVVGLALTMLVWSARRDHPLHPRWAMLAVLASTCFTTPPSGIETRMVLPLWFLAYILVFMADWRGWWSWQRELPPARSARLRWQLPVTVGAWLLAAWLIYRVVSAASGQLVMG